MKPTEVKLNSTRLEPANNAQTGSRAHPLKESINFVDFLSDQLGVLQFNSSGSDTDSAVSDEKAEKLEKIKEKEKTETLAINMTQDNKTTQTTETSTPKKDKDFADNFLKLDARQLSSPDMKQVQQLLQNNGIAVNINQLNGLTNYGTDNDSSQYSYKSLNFAKNLSEALNQSYKTNRPIRIDLENNSAVILKIDKDGKLSAQFISSDKAMEALLRENLYLLRAKLEKEGLPYKDLSFKDQSDNQHRREPDQK